MKLRQSQAQDRSLLQLSRWTLLNTGSPDVPNSDLINTDGSPPTLLPLKCTEPPFQGTQK